MSKKQEKKVYCKDCRKLREYRTPGKIGHYCDNKDVIYHDTWFDVEVDRNKLPDPSKINANNDCKDYEKGE